jgi:hypothetical protein
MSGESKTIDYSYFDLTTLKHSFFPIFLDKYIKFPEGYNDIFELHSRSGMTELCIPYVQEKEKPKYTDGQCAR